MFQFGFGRRSCPGQAIAELQILIFTVNLLRYVKIERQHTAKYKFLDVAISKWIQIIHFWIQKLRKSGLVYFQKDQRMHIKVDFWLWKIPKSLLQNDLNKTATSAIKLIVLIISWSPRGIKEFEPQRIIMHWQLVIRWDKALSNCMNMLLNWNMFSMS